MNSSNLTSQLPASSWFTASTNLSLPESAGHWPWAHILTIDEWTSIILNIRKVRQVIYDFVSYSNVAIYCLGIPGSILTVLTVALMPKPSITAFHYVMCLIALFDAIFDVFKFLRFLVQVFDGSLRALEFYGYASGIAYTFSLASDMVTIALSMERYLALAWPVLYQGVSRRTKRRAWTIAVLLSIVIGSSRMHYAFDTFDYPGAIYNERWFKAIVFVSDTIIPFLITGVMMVFVLGITRAVYGRVKQKKPQQSALTSKQKGVNEAMKTISLLVVLLVMFFLNQFGYILYTVANIQYARESSNLSYNSSLDEIRHYSNTSIFLFVASGLSSPLESLSRALPFYMYVLFSGSFRLEFLRAMRKLWRGKNEQQVAACDGGSQQQAGNLNAESGRSGGGAWVA